MVWFLIIALVIMIILIFGFIINWAKNMKNVRSAEYKVKLKISTRETMWISVVWGALSLSNLFLSIVALINSLALRDDYIIDNTVSKKTVMGIVTKTVTETPYDSIIEKNKLEIVFYAVVLVSYIIYMLSIRSSYITENGLYHGSKSYKPDDIKYIMDDDMKMPVLIYRRTNYEFTVKKVFDAVLCREILLKNYKDAKYYSEQKALKYNGDDK